MRKLYGNVCVYIVDMCRCAESFFSRFLFADSRSNFTCFNSVLRIELTAPICRREIKHSGDTKNEKEREEEKESELWASRMMLNSTLEDSKLIIIPNYAETNVVFLLLLLFIVTSRIISYAIRSKWAAIAPNSSYEYKSREKKYTKQQQYQCQ